MSIEEQKNFILGSINRVIVKWNMDSNEFVVPKLWENMTGYAVPKKINFFRQLRKIICPDDIEKFDRTLKENIYDGVNYFECEYKIKTKSGKIKWILQKSRIFVDNKKCRLMINCILDVTNKKIYESEIRYLAYYDSVTDVPNKLSMTIKLNNFLSSADKYGKKNLALFYICIYNFEKIKDIYREDFEEALLKKVSDIFKDNLDNEVLCKVEESKFAIIDYSCGSVEKAKLKAEYLLSLFNKIIEINGERVFMALNIGISVCTDDVSNSHRIMKNADIALINAKKLGKNQYELYDGEMNAEIVERVKIENDLARAIANKEFILYYQPQVDISRMKICGLEALIRWNHNGSIRLPSYFIDIAEQNGMINEIGKFVLYEAFMQIKKCDDLGYKQLYMSVNISEKQLRQNSFLDFVNYALKSTGIRSNRICFEITERILIDISEKILNVLFKIKDMGIKIFIDDFGTKYSSLNYLKDLPIDGIKIDKSFVYNIQSDGKSRVILKNIVNLAKDLNIEVIAEGVETDGQLRFLESIECSRVQGYVFSRPINSEKLIENLENSYAIWDNINELYNKEN
ncbi:bifunctional diguanylate cyclase/phosphodiesterase [Clostridium luticellarii]|uniref:Phytochrome-like protein cph2 n=1 Tax=Clostridium luticellarii TaxID=1691940 RepID=A0A2T0BME7_9CLOT|nr:EAL domain-containing protein [Clostridium luticellarii]MCI1944989.1 EAL domain-containing protein [Clostridium luticellarii]MCI1967861.1 EAL domain-containing protein [Clostridium luticellarii]MCI2040744.1 EAL domain-containing protein [Clostridium luticellarii]PRR85051.1 Phytochrome-like protein cph2 [Clostridium luticellarii]